VGDIFSYEQKAFMKNKNNLAFIKRLAKKLKKDNNITHTQALEMAAKMHGYSNWMHCSRVLSQQKDQKIDDVKLNFELSFTDWLKRHSKRDSPLGDLSCDMLRDNTWPNYNTLEEYISYLSTKNTSYAAVATLKKAWQTYSRYLKQKKSPAAPKQSERKVSTNKADFRKITYVKNITPVPFGKRNTEQFSPGDKAWISWDASKAIPVTITEVDDRHYSVRIERPVSKAGDQHFLFLDEVRSTPKLACLNYVTS